MHIWTGTHGRQAGIPWFSVKLRGDWRTYRRKVLWIGPRYIGVQAKASTLPRVGVPGEHTGDGGWDEGWNK